MIPRIARQHIDNLVIRFAFWLIPKTAKANRKKLTHATFWYVKNITYFMCDNFPIARLHHFFVNTSLRISWSSCESAYIFLSLVFSSRSDLISLISEASMSLYFYRHLQKVPMLMPCSRQISGTFIPASCRLSMLQICDSENREVFMIKLLSKTYFIRILYLWVLWF